MPYSDAWGATIQTDVPTVGDVTLSLTDSVFFNPPVTVTVTAKTLIGAKDQLAQGFMSQPGPAPRIWWLRYRIARAVATRAKWVLLRAVYAAGNQNRLITREDPYFVVNPADRYKSNIVTKTAAQWVVMVDQKIAEAQADWDARVAAAKAEGADE